MKTCLFCQIVNKALPAQIIFENDTVMAFLSLENHPLIVPKKHFETIYDLEDLYAENIMKAAVIIANATRSTTGCDGINLIQSNGEAAGQDVFHFHLHIKPRWDDDEVVLKWDTKRVDEAARTELCQKIKRAL